MTIQAANLPLPPALNGRSYRLAKITVPCTKQRKLNFQNYSLKKDEKKNSATCMDEKRV